MLGYMSQQQGMYDYFSVLEFLLFCVIKRIEGKRVEKTDWGIAWWSKSDLGKKLKSSRISWWYEATCVVYAGITEWITDFDIRWANGRTQPEKRIRKYISSIFGNKIVLIATHVVSDVECIVKEIM